MRDDGNLSSARHARVTHASPAPSVAVSRVRPGPRNLRRNEVARRERVRVSGGGRTAPYIREPGWIRNRVCQ
jgi:hypothetical protein